MSHQSRRDFFKTAGLSVAAASALVSSAYAGQFDKKSKECPLKLGMASYTFRKFSLEETLKMTQKVGVDNIAFKSMHLPLDSTPEQIKDVAAKTKAAGLNLYGCGVVYMQDEAQVNQAFEYAKAAGMKMIIGVPEHNLLELVNKKIKEYDIMVAIHNHGPGDKRYPAPSDAYDRIKNMDKRFGLCMDIGHTQRIGLDPSGQAKKYIDRLLDVHIKDVTESTEKGSTLQVGRGVIDIPKFLKTLIDLDYKGIVSLEYEKDGDDPLDGAAESIGYVKGVLATL